jgi:DNA-binding MarR family transcriptional regulator
MPEIVALSQHLAFCKAYSLAMARAQGRQTSSEAEVLMQASKVISAAVAHSLAIADETVSAPGLRVLVMLEDSGPLNLSAVAAGLGVNASTASRTCDRLVVAGLVDRREHADDRRQVALSLTERGADFVDGVMRERQAVLMRVLESMPADARERAVDGLAEFVAAATAMTDGEPSRDGHTEIIRWLV